MLHFFCSVAGIAPAPKNAERKNSFHDGETQLKLLTLAADYDCPGMRAAAFELQQTEGSLPLPDTGSW